jgi:hypothetical protein
MRCDEKRSTRAKDRDQGRRDQASDEEAASPEALARGEDGDTILGANAALQQRES